MSGYSDPHVIELAGRILIVSIVVLSVIVTFLSFLHLYSKWTSYRREENTHRHPHPHRRREDSNQPGVTVLRRGLNPSFLKTIPVIPFDSKEFAEGLECAVCLSEVGDGEETRILPKCNHGFHVECIDMWFYSHSTCPICRNPVSVVEPEISVENLLEIRQTTEESNDFPTNVLFWGNETEVSTLTSQLEEASSYHQTASLPSTCEPPSSSSSSSSSTQIDLDHLVIEIPSEIDCSEEQKSPVSSRMRSFRRILSGGRRFINNPFSPAS